jgi:hypothetical protein
MRYLSHLPTRLRTRFPQLNAPRRAQEPPGSPDMHNLKSALFANLADIPVPPAAVAGRMAGSRFRQHDVEPVVVRFSVLEEEDAAPRAEKRGEGR